MSLDWFATGADGKDAFTADGTDDAYWSVFRFQPMESTNGYTNDYRFSPLDTVTPYIYKAD